MAVDPRRQPHAEFASLIAARASRRNAAAVKLHELLDQREAEPEAAIPGARARVALIEHLEDPGALGFRQTGAVVNDVHRDLAVLARNGQGDVAASRREFHRIVEQVGEDLRQAGAVGDDLDLVVGTAYVERELLAIDQGPHGVDRGGDDLRHRDDLPAQLEFPAC